MKLLKIVGVVLAVVAVTGVLIYQVLLKPPHFEYAGQAPEPLSRQLPEDTGWLALFDGTSLAGWTPKFVGHAVGVNFANTWRAGDGVLSAHYTDYDRWNGEFGHLFYHQPFTAFVLQLEYRFSGDQIADGLLMQWAWRNSGVMFHSEPPASMRLDQDFPVSIEAQLLGGTAAGGRRTGNVCTPDTHIVLNGALHTPHCTNSLVPAVAGDGWVKFELEVHADGTVRHFVDDRFALAYQLPQLDPDSADGARLAAARGATDLTLRNGYIALQAESHPVAFRKIRIYPLDNTQ